MSKELVIKIAGVSDNPAGTVVLYANDGPELSGAGQDVWAQTKLDWNAVATSASFEARAGQVLDVLAPANIAADRVLVLGAGKPDDEAALSPAGMRDRGGSLMAKLGSAKVKQATIFVDGLAPEAVAEVAAGLRLRHYRFDKYKTKKADDHNAQPEKTEVTFFVSDKSAVNKALKESMAIAEGILLARDLVNEPPNVLGPVEFAEVARSFTDLGIEVEILTLDEMEKLGMGALLAVAQGSVRPGRLAVMQWHGGKKGDAPIAFVGKGVVFDTGGISIKPAGGMEDMKGDMGGAAAVTGVIKALATRKAKANVVGIIGLVENMPDGNAYRPGDILTSMSGQTIEVVNTDAEGRLVLADALWYTQDRFKPALMVNLATLTGAIMVGLGQEYAGLFSNNDALAQKLFDAGVSSGEKLWRMPMGNAYNKLIDSRFADMKNTGGRYGGSITAAQFLERFVNDVPWAHLDIAGAAFSVGANETNVSWAPGFGVRLLDQLVRDNYEN